MEKIMTTRELAVEMGLPQWTVWKWARAGRLPSFRVNGRIFFRASAITARLAELEATNRPNDNTDNRL